MFKKNEHYDLELEKSVLGVFLLEPHSFGSCRSVVDEDCFYDENHKTVFRAISEYWENGGLIDLIAINRVLCDKGVTELNGGNTAYFLTGLTMDVVSSAHLEAWCFFLRELAAKRLAIKSTKDIDFSGDVFEIVAEIDAKVKKAMEVKSSSDWLNSGEITQQLIKNLSTPKGEMSGLTTGSKVIDSMNGGLKPGNMIIIAARPGMGKSAYMGKMAMDIVRSGKKVGVISLEMPAVDVFARMVAAATGVAHWKIDRGQIYDKAESEAVYNKLNSFNALPIYFSDTAKSSAFDIRAKAEKLQRKNGLDILFIDYLQLIESEGKKNKNRENEVSEISRGMKLLAMDLKIPVVCLAQLNREAAKGKPELHHLRESGCLLGDTEILTGNGTMKIEDMNNMQGFGVYSSYSGIRKFEARKCWKTKVASVKDMTLTTGHQISATGNHKFLTDDGWLPLDQIRPGDKVAIPINFKDTGKAPYSVDLAYLMGAMIANGKTVARQPITYTCNSLDQDLAEQVHQIAESEFDCISRTDDNSGKYSWTNVYIKSKRPPSRRHRNPFVMFIEKEGIYNKIGKEKSLPDSIFYASKDIQLNMLAGLFDNDGSIHLKHGSTRVMTIISYSSASKELVSGIQMLLQMNGMVSRIKECRRDQHLWYQLYLSDRPSKLLFCEKVPIRSLRKISEVAKIKERLSGTISGWSKTIYSNDKSLAFVEVGSITDREGEFPVYDIEVPIAHNFVANGILAHNSLEQDADVVIFIHREWEAGNQTNAHGESTENEADILVRKWRNGRGYMDVKMGWRGETMEFYDLDTTTDRPQPTSLPRSTLTIDKDLNTPF